MQINRHSLTKPKRTTAQIVGANFQRRREQLGLTKTSVGASLGYGREWVRRLENGQTDFGIAIAPRVKEVLQLSNIEELLRF